MAESRLRRFLLGEETLSETEQAVVTLKEQNDRLVADLDKAKNLGDLHQLLESNLDQMIGTLEQGGANMWTSIGMGQNGNPDLQPIERIKLIRIARQYWLKDPLIHQAVQLTTHYTFGRGLRYSCNNQDIQKAMDNFWLDDDNQIEFTGHMAQEQKSAELQVDGEIFFILFEDASGNIKVRTLPPEEITAVITSPDDYRRPMYYERQYVPQKYVWNNGVGTMGTGSGGSYINEEPQNSIKVTHYADWRNHAPGQWGWEPKGLKLSDGVIFHVAVNKISWQRRGYTETYAALDWVKAHRQMLQDWVTIVKAYSSLAWKAKIKGDDPRSFEAIRNKIRAVMPQFYASGAQPATPAGVAGVAFEPEGVDYQPMKTAGMATNPQDARQIRLMAGAGMGIAEHYFGDPGNANLATASAMDLPMLKKFESRQRLWEGVYAQILNFQVMRLVELNQINGLKIVEETDDQGRIVSKRLDVDDRTGENKVVVQAPPILQRNLAEVAQSLVPLVEVDLIPIKEGARYALKAMDVPNAEEILDEMEKEGKFEDPPVDPNTGLPMPKGSDPSLVKDPIEMAQKLAAVGGVPPKAGRNPNDPTSGTPGAQIPKIRINKATPPDETNGGGPTA